jgi:HPt (histidine-containing phosphotransfer) domain-containing protein
MTTSNFRTTPYWHQCPNLDLNTVGELVEASRASGRDLFTQLFQRVQEGQALDVIPIKEAFLANDLTSLASLAHTFKGTAILHGLARAAALAAEIVSATQGEGDNSQIEALCTALPDTLKEGLDELRATVAQLK